VKGGRPGGARTDEGAARAPRIGFAAPPTQGYTARRLKLPALAVALLALTLLAGCTTGRYLAQAGCGQIDLLLRARDIGAVARDPHVDARLRRLLAQVPEIKKFGEENSLRPTGNYHRYVALDRPAVVWVTTASEPLRFHSKTWWFPIVGTVPYLGWFDRDDARELADELHEEGWDSDVGAADAYSTLGWFDDPVLSTMISEGDEATGLLVNVILHESVHATLYVDGQTRFNESLAEYSAGKLAVTYLDRRYGVASAEKASYLDAERRGAERAAQMHRAYETLAKLYASSRSPEEKLAEKQRVLTALRRETRFRRPINNATLSAFKNYNSGTPELDALFSACGGSWARFFGTLRTLKKRGSFVTPNQADLGPVLRPLTTRGCPG
jgi:predicted aminopeptidase